MATKTADEWIDYIQSCVEEFAEDQGVDEDEIWPDMAAGVLDAECEDRDTAREVLRRTLGYIPHTVVSRFGDL